MNTNNTTEDISPQQTTPTNPIRCNNPHALKTAQEADELFEVMEPPLTGDGRTFDMLNDRPKSTGQFKIRKEVHRDKDWHRSVHVWLVDTKRGLIALQKRSATKDTFPGRWDISAAGHIEAGVVDSRETAVRELAEELGIDDVVKGGGPPPHHYPELIFGFTCPAEQAGWGGCNAYEDVYFLERDSAECNFAIGVAEVTDVKWMKIHDFEQALRNRDEEYVPRVDKYMDAFFQHLASMMMCMKCSF
mmetsp:Transcript_7594/g.10331  ORF Transcript_7594/g.10331 Transcript_7594/m.10331 type:complete len:246 (-) Transcript_7594:64-801(-)|eukprot:CAMPEP_0185740518 /NCGR_PEP_ID=MMETSP1171-20130828/37947_1 /TAXON_ID=374046 /ORGANISM="Helicotheca tamensis, Strain CCMP826" /LENGTH=245 /DNA_ID=CAMNT_0028412385 /DNA_START=17 /DNA_END=754 /DNA_ORIENTATION=-